MSKKTIFEPSIIKKDKQFEGLKYKEFIDWVDIDIKKYLEALKDVVLPLHVEEEPCYKLGNYITHKIVAKCPINKNLKMSFDLDDQFMYFITDDEFKELYISIQVCYPVFWYKFTTRQQFFGKFDEIFETYNKEEYKLDYDTTCRAFIGNEKMLDLDIDILEKHFIVNKYTEFILWGSKWKDNPFRDLYLSKKINIRQHSVYTPRAMEQLSKNTYSINVRTEFSKSILTIEDYEGAFIVDIQYDPIDTPHIDTINKLTDREYPLDLPIDVVISLINLHYITHIGLLKLRPLASTNFSMSALVANTQEMCQDTIAETKRLLKKSDKYHNILDKDTKDYAVEFVKHLETNLKIDDIFSMYNISKYIDDRIVEINSNKKTLIVAHKEVVDKLDEILKTLQMNETNFKTHLNSLIEDIFKQRLKAR